MISITLSGKGGEMKTVTFILALVLLLGFFAVAQGDIVIKRKSSTEGMMGIGSGETMATEYYQVDRNCSEHEKITEKGNQPQDIQITRLDKSLIWNLNVKKQTYRETPLESFKEIMAKAEESKVQDKETPGDTTYTWTFEITTPEGTKDINGFPCRNLTARAIGVNKKDPQDRMRITFDFWLSKDVPSMAELEEYSKNYAKALGLGDYQVQQDMTQMANQYGAHFAELSAKLKEVGGYPIKTTMMIEKGSGSDQEGQKQAAAMAKLGGLFGKKTPKQSADGMMTLTSMSNEIVSIQSTSVDAAKFEVPAGFKKK
jgi:hypothetical protein